MHRTIAALVLASIALTASSAPAEPGTPHHGHSQHHHHSSRPDSYAPIGVMGEHMHPAGGWMLSYRFAYMRMDGNRDGTRRLSKQDVLKDFMVTPTDMDMYMHMFSVMAAPTDWFTAMVMLPWIQKSMDHETRMGTRFTTTSNNLGDVRTSGLFRLYQDEMHHLHLNFGMSWPTGQIRVKDQTPAGRATLPFPMQIGSGTFDMIPGLTYTGQTDRFSWGAQILGTYRIGENESEYTVSDRIDFTSWLAYPWTSWLSTSGRIVVNWWSNYGGDEQRAPPPPTIPTARPDLRGGTAFQMLGGINLYLPLGPLGRHRFAIEAGGPVEQWLDGPQLETDWHVMVGWQKAF